MDKKVCKLILVEVNEKATGNKAKQSNKFYNMYEQGDGTYKVEYGRVDVSCTTISAPMSKWDKTIKSKIKKGYKDITHLCVDETEEDTNESGFSDISDAVINKLFAELQQYANNTIKANYKISANKVTQPMVDEAQKCVDDLSVILLNNLIVEDFNKKLLELFHVIPRRMNDVSQWLVDISLTGDDLRTRCEKLLDKEQSTLDVMAGQVVVHAKTNDDKELEVEDKKTILEALGLEVVTANDDEIHKIKDLMGNNRSQFKKAYAVKNKKTQTAFDNYLSKIDNKKTELFWHGSRNQNWLNILSTGLMIRPAGAIHTGSMFGDGIYFADKAQKSIGYTSLRGSYWTRGGDDKAYLALFSVHVGNQKDILHHNSSCYKLCESKIKDEGYDSVFAHGGADLRNNEYIVYNQNQCTVSYLIEIGS